MDWKQQIRLASRIVAASALAFLVVSAILFGLVQTNWGIRELARFVSTLEGELTFAPGRVSGVFPFRFEMEKLSISDTRGLWLEARGLKVYWSPLPLIRGRMAFKELAAASVNFDRLPALSNGAAGPLPSWIFAFRSDRFIIDRLAVGKELLGEQAVLKLDGRIPLSSPGRDLDASLRIERVDRAGSLLQVNIALGGETRFLKTEIAFDEERGGLLGKALGVEGPVSLSLSGQGTLELWGGKILAGLLPFGRLAADLEVNGRENPLLRMRGTLHPALETMPSLIRIWSEKDLPFELETRLRWPKALIVELFEVKTPQVSLSLKGDFDLNQRSSGGQFSLTCLDLKPLSEVLGLAAAGNLVSQGTFSTRHRSVRFSATGSAENLQVGNSERVLGKNVSWEFRGEGSPSEVLSIAQMKIGAENLLLEGSGEVRIPESAAAMDALFEIKDLQKLSSLEPLAAWRTQGRAHASWNLSTGALSSRLQGKLKPPAGVTPPFLAREIDYSGTLSLENGTTLNFSHLEMASPAGTLQAKGNVHFHKETLEATWHLLLPHLDLLSATLKGGPAEIRGTVQGPLKALTLSADATAGTLSVSGFPFDSGRASLRAEMGDLTKGSVNADAQIQELVFRGQADFDLSNSRLNLKRIFMEGGKSTLTGGLSLFLDTGLAEGSLNAECKDLAALSPLTHEKVQGSALLQARLFPSQDGQKVSLLVNAVNLESPFGKAVHSRIEAHGTLSEKAPRGRVAIEIQNGIIGDLALSSSTLIVEGDLGHPGFQLALEGDYKDPFEIKGSGVLALLSAEKRMTLNRLEGRYRGIPVSLLQPAGLAHSPKGIDLGEWMFKAGSGQFQGTGYVRPTDLSVDLRFEGISLQTIPLKETRDLGGLARGNARLRGSPVNPEGSGTLQIETLRFADQGLPASDWTVHAALRDRLLKSTFLIQGLSDAPLKGDTEGPLHLSLWPMTLAFPPHGEIRGRLKGKIPLAGMTGFVEHHEEKLAGIVEIDLGLEGPWGKPRVSGWLQLRGGAYENLRTGTILRGIEADMAAQGSMLVVNRAIAGDGEKGTLSAQGQVEFSPGQGFPFKLNIALEKVKPFRYDRVSAVAGGDMTLTGSVSGALLSGRILVDTAELGIPDRLAPEIQDLQVIEINKPEGAQRAATEAGTSRMWPLSLSLAVQSPGRVFLRGRGLDSEWQGEVRIEGEARQPLVTGALSVVRGSVNFLGKRFEIKQGSLSFDGSTPPRPWIHVQAESRSREIVAHLAVTGPVQSPKIALTSDPPFPPDEILSRLLFGRTASNITPLQAIQLADSVNTLARGGGLDLLSQTRQLLGLDQLTIKQQTGKAQEKSALSAGKYLSEDVYLEVQQGISPETGKASLKWEITPSITVETEVGVNAEAGVGINWRWDY